ncbi:ferritin-like domain-containing protein [Parasediminibacterium sp. JCM 36343]|uniref:ferritin-like domain-containing protein n=1 Tax=Parasediminibacterium sp. JCM 36343 TaxID=3374279 RepID=UPI00397E453C
MNLQNILSEIENVDPEIYERISTRRNSLSHLGNMGKRVALTALPFALGAMLTKAYGQTVPPSVIATLNFALKLEYLESSFYANGLTSSGLIPAADVAAIQIISQHESQHVTFLKAAITGAGGTPVASPTIDFTAGGTITNLFSNYDVFLAYAQTFEDTGVRAYKGQAGSLQGSAYLAPALQIHAVEARHASKIRQIRAGRSGTVAGVKPWITSNYNGIASSTSTSASYTGEEVSVQAGLNIVGINGYTSITATVASEAFDEPLTSADVLAIVKPFGIS